jgi:hypothetical protein
MECSKKDTWFATVKVKTVPAFFSEAKYDRLFVTQKVLEAEDDKEHHGSPGRNFYKDKAALDEAQQAARQRVKDRIKLESEQRLQSDLKSELMPLGDSREALDLGEIRK